MRATKRSTSILKMYNKLHKINDDYIINLTNNIEVLETSYLRENMIKHQYEISYINKVISNIPIENRLLTQSISNTLYYTRVLLFKAMIKDPGFNINDNNKNFNHLLNLEYNNIDKLLYSIDQIKIHKLYKANHSNILLQDKHIIRKILSTD